MEASPEPKESSSHQVQPMSGCWRSSRPFSFVQWHKHQCTARPTLVSPKAYITMYMEDNNAPPTESSQSCQQAIRLLAPCRIAAWPTRCGNTAGESQVLHTCNTMPGNPELTKGMQRAGFQRTMPQEGNQQISLRNSAPPAKTQGAGTN